MKIVILVRILWTAGAQKIAIAEYHALTRQGHDVRLIFLRGTQFHGYEDALRGVNYSVVRTGKGTLASPIFGYLTRKFMPDRGPESTVDYDLIRMFPRSLRGDVPDLLICHDQWAGLAGYYARKKSGVPYRVFIHEKLSPYRLGALGALAASYERRVLTDADLVLAVTPRVAATIQSRYKIPVVPNLPGMDLKSCAKFRTKKERIVSVAMWDSGRQPSRYLPLIEALDGFEFIFAGNWRSSSAKSRFETELASRHLKPRVTLRSGLSEAQLDLLYREAKYSIRYGFAEYGPGLGVIESIQHCVPPIVNRDLGISELVQRYECGLVTSTTVTEPARNWIEEHNNGASYESLQRGLLKLTQTYTWARHSEVLVAAPGDGGPAISPGAT